MRRFFRKLNLNKRKIWSVGIIAVIFVMSLGYAALSQHMDIEGITVIDRHWNLKAEILRCWSPDEGIIENATTVGTTLSLTATIPYAKSTVECKVIIRNKGNMTAKLSSIEVIEDKNTGISYTITGLEEGKILKPGADIDNGDPNIATITVKFAEGVTNVSNTEKSLMITFNYVEDVGNSIQGDGYVPITGQEEYSKGEEVTLVDGSRWYVVNDSGSDEELVTLFAANTIDNCAQFDPDGYNDYNADDTNNISYCLNNIYLSKLKTSIENSGGDVTGITVRLVTTTEITALTTANKASTQVTSTGQRTWAIDDLAYYDSWALLTDGEVSITSAYNIIGTRPVITLLKENILDKLADRILADNNEQSDSSIDFAEGSSDTNGKGLYYTSTNTEENKTTYYFRGNVTNNYVSFANQIWRIVRINEDGSVRLITQEIIGESEFNISADDNAYVGYMYGDVGASSYKATHANTTNSAIKGYLDDWYRNMLSNYSDLFATNAGFCNDRSITSGAGYSSAVTSYASNDRLYNLNQPQFKCPNESNDLFTLSTSSKGNKALDYPIGLLTADEIVYAGGGTGNAYYNHYLATDDSWFTMTPINFDGLVSSISATDADGDVFGVEPPYFYSVRPVINLKADASVKSGNGSSGSPYVIATESNPSLVQQIMTNNKIQSDENVDFASISTTSNGNGLNVRTENTAGKLPTYYFRGNVENNYVSFANKLWRIVRINEDGSVKLVIDAPTTVLHFNNSTNDNTYVGYMYGTAGATSYSSAHSNNNNSQIKTSLESWYESNLNSYTPYIADSFFCNDRGKSSTAYVYGSDDTALGYGTNITIYNANIRNYHNHTPQTKCLNYADAFTKYYGSYDLIGNGKLTHSIGLLTADEITLAGANFNNNNTSFYLYTGNKIWTMSPSVYSSGYAYIVMLDENGKMGSYSSNSNLYARPVINLINGIRITGGNGTSSSPYVIKTN